jgi:hypothetical protein
MTMQNKTEGQIKAEALEFAAQQFDISMKLCSDLGLKDDALSNSMAARCCRKWGRDFAEMPNPSIAAADKSDANVDAVREKLLSRSQRGIQKYGTTTERTDLAQLEWLQHAQEEAMDFCVYLQRLIVNEQRRMAGCKKP